MIEAKARPPLVVLGCGSWGTALALYGASRFERVTLWGPFSEEIDALTRDRENKKYIPGVVIPQNIHCTTSLEEAFKENCIVLVSVPSHVFIKTIQAIAPFVSQFKALIIATKGVTEEGLFLHERTKALLTGVPIAMLSGPSFAKEVAQKMPTAITLASMDTAMLEELHTILHSPSFRVFPSDDLYGVAIGGVVKNVIAIAVGMSDGVGFGANARAALITQGLQEMSVLNRAVGGKEETIVSLAALGDMVLTTTDNQSRNRRFGIALGLGQSVDLAEEEIGQVVEGKRNVKELLLLAARYQVDLPIAKQVYQVVYEGKSAKQAMLDILNLPV